MTSHTQRARSDSVGFTLIELLVVIAIIGILATILMPNLSTMRHRAASTRCESLLKDMERGQQLWMDDNKGCFISTGYMPSCPGKPWSFNLQKYLSATSFFCSAYQTTTWGNTTYGYWGYYRTTPSAYLCVDPVPLSACYKSSDFSQPTKVPVFLDWDGSSTAVYVDLYWNSKIATIAPTVLRHLGAMNVVYLDGHVGYKKDTIYATISRTNGF